jgi:hypothetical protein
MPVDLKHLSASTRERVNKVRDAYADADTLQRELMADGINVIMGATGTREVIRVELLDPEMLAIKRALDAEPAEGNDRRGPEFGIGLDIGGGEEP